MSQLLYSRNDSSVSVRGFSHIVKNTRLAVSQGELRPVTLTPSRTGSALGHWLILLSFKSSKMIVTLFQLSIWQISVKCISWIRPSLSQSKWTNKSLVTVTFILLLTLVDKVGLLGKHWSLLLPQRPGRENNANSNLTISVPWIRHLYQQWMD